MEIWKEIKITNGRYSVSNLGRVRSNERKIVRGNGRIQKINSKILTPILNSTGYWKVRLNIKQAEQKNIPIHKIVATEFIKKGDGRLVINHKDGNKLNNNVQNLEWVTYKRNIQHAWELGLSKSDHKKKKILWGGLFFDSVNEVESFTGINRNTITSSANKGYFIYRNYKVIFKGVEYNSLKEAGRITGFNPKTIARYGKVTKPEKITVSWITA